MLVKVKLTWIPMKELDPPHNWSLPFVATWRGQKYKITGADYIDRVWRGEKVNG